MSNYASQIKKLDMEVARLQTQIKKIKEERKKIADQLYIFMDRERVDKIDGISVDKLKPKQRVKQKKKADKKRDGIEFLESLGLNDPEGAYAEFLATQKRKEDGEY